MWDWNEINLRMREFFLRNNQLRDAQYASTTVLGPFLILSRQRKLNVCSSCVDRRCNLTSPKLAHSIPEGHTKNILQLLLSIVPERKAAS